MKIAKIKTEMKAFRDFYGGDLLGVSDIGKAKTKKELAEILIVHERYMEDMLLDAKNHIDTFKEKLGLRSIDLIR